VELHARRNARSANNLGKIMDRFQYLAVFVIIKHASNMAARFVNGVNDVTASDA